MKIAMVTIMYLIQFLIAFWLLWMLGVLMGLNGLDVPK